MGKSYHFIAIGGSVMHALAIELKKSGHQVTGSDDAIYGKSAAALKAHGLLPKEAGWHSDRITAELDAVILGMHAQGNNPELKTAKELGVPVYSFPDFIYELSKNKQRIVVAGSHGKTTITAMIMHVLKYCGKEFDYLIGAEVPGFENQVKISEASTIVIEGDEYLTSAEDSDPKFMKYHHHIGIISGIDWDHANVFPDEKEYIQQFHRFADATPKAGTLIYNTTDSLVAEIGDVKREDVYDSPYELPPYEITDGITYLVEGDKKIPLKIYGEHNLLNLSAVRSLMDKISLTDEDFLEAIQSFEGASRRLETIKRGHHTVIRDFAHAPSKVRASVKAVQSQFPGSPVCAVVELHTFSSLNKDFVSRYKDSLQGVDLGMVFFQPGHKSVDEGKMVSTEDIQAAFALDGLMVIQDKDTLEGEIQKWMSKSSSGHLLLMSSGQLGGLEIENI